MSLTEFASLGKERIRAVIHVAKEGGYWATVPTFPGCVTEGDTIEEVKENIVEAAEVWLCTKFRAALHVSIPRRRTAKAYA